MSNASKTNLDRSPITVDKKAGIYATETQKAGTKTAQLRQTVIVKSIYPSKKVDSNMQDSLFAPDTFGFGEQEFTSTEERVAWIFVHPSATVESVQKAIDEASKNGACIYRVLSSEPIIDNNQMAGISLGYRTKDSYANTQVVRKPAKDGIKGDIILDQKTGLPFYRRTFFKKTATPDQDLRDASKSYVSPEIALELNGVSAILENQAI